VAALYAVNDPRELRGEGESYRAALVEALCDLPRIRRLAANPVMLTCLCVVHWNEGRLPDGRSRVYRAVLRWLIASRTPLREQEGFTDPFAETAFARLALAMVRTEDGKKAVFDLEEAAVAIDADVERQFPQLSPEERRREARRWLAFECLGSGIVEELPGRRLRFWHLTFQEFLSALQLAWLDDGEESSAPGRGAATPACGRKSGRWCRLLASWL
jgi:predicted NACHT family NTPase